MNATEPADGQHRSHPQLRIPASRRSVLAAGLGLLGLPALAACGVQVRLKDFGPPPTLTPDAEELARRAVVAAILAAQELAGHLSPDDEHQLKGSGVLAEQLEGLGGAGAGAPSPTAPAPTASASRSSPEQVLGAVVAIAATAAAQVPLVSGPLARRMASVMAGAHVLARQFAEDASLKQPGPPKVPGTAPAGTPSPTSAPPSAGTTTAPPSPSGAIGDAPSDAATAALVEYLRGVQAATYGYQVLSVRLQGDEAKRATGRTAQLQRIAADVAAELRAVSADVPAPEPGYTLPSPVDNAGDARALGGSLESRLADLAGGIVATAPAGTRATPSAELLDSALLAWQWVHTVEALPGSGLDDAGTATGPAPTGTPSP